MGINNGGEYEYWDAKINEKPYLGVEGDCRFDNNEQPVIGQMPESYRNNMQELYTQLQQKKLIGSVGIPDNTISDRNQHLIRHIGSQQQKKTIVKSFTFKISIEMIDD